MQRPSVLLIAAFLLSGTACDQAGPRHRHPDLGSDHRVVRKGETLYSIAAEEYGDPLAWPLLQEANPWLEPERLRPGEIIYVPPGERGNRFNVDPYGVRYESVAEAPKKKKKTRNASAEAATGTGRKETAKMSDPYGFFQNLVPELSGRTLFGEPVDRIGIMALGGVFLHAFVQGFLLWIIATVTFVRNVTLRKSLRAAFQTEVITLFSVVVLGGVAVLMVHIGTTAPGGESEADLLKTLETYLRHPITPVIGGFSIFGLYLLLAMRFIPQIFGIQRAQTLLIVLVAILAPHLMGFYTLGQRLGIVNL